MAPHDARCLRAEVGVALPQALRPTAPSATISRGVVLPPLTAHTVVIRSSTVEADAGLLGLFATWAPRMPPGRSSASDKRAPLGQLRYRIQHLLLDQRSLCRGPFHWRACHCLSGEFPRLLELPLRNLLAGVSRVLQGTGGRKTVRRRVRRFESCGALRLAQQLALAFRHKVA